MRHQVEPKYITYTAAFTFFFWILNDDSEIDRFKLRDRMENRIQMRPRKILKTGSIRAPLKESRLD